MPRGVIPFGQRHNRVGIESLIAIDVPDYSIDQAVYVLAKGLLEQNYKIGFGCFGAHGRTGWLAAKLIMHFEKCSGDKAVKLIRKRLCHECVESQVQFDDLGCKKYKEELLPYLGWNDKDKEDKEDGDKDETKPLSPEEEEAEAWARYEEYLGSVGYYQYDDVPYKSHWRKY